ncbi:MAG: DEAD/DEAH box helicase family protein [Ignavibacteria bacterium]|nr:DEAD/DEAH box helicase family protein [Ignavibacteria bacterium]
MELKEYQHKALDRVRQYLEALSKQISSGNTKHASEDAWETLGQWNYISRKDGRGRDLTNFCLKIPTGGGKTFLAVKTIDHINTILLKRRTGLVLWVVPTTQIYNQTIQSLHNRIHPYRQHLDIASGGRTVVLEKTDGFTPLDIQENLVVLMLMLPSASRQNKETLKVFQDSGGFQDFFPAEDDVKGHEELLSRIPNLDAYGKGNGFWGKQIKTSLGNTLRLISPIIILDEGHKAYSETAQATLRGFNPSIIIELSATPPEESNVLVEITGGELHREEMIKLDLHVINKASPDWTDAMRDVISRRNLLEEKAKNYEANTGQYIRPICLIQVERTGKDQRDSGYIHSEEVREWLIKTQGISPEQVAVKTSEKDELKEVDDIGGLMSKDCQIRYIITKHALQEGWDCAFAYALCVLTNPSSKTALTQLVGRILRQPYARKTRVQELDESYVYCFQQKGANLLQEIRHGFAEEGLGDLTGRISIDQEDTNGKGQTRAVSMREKFKKSATHVILPVFVIKDSKGWRKVNYEMDIASRIPWDEVNLEKVFTLTLSKVNVSDVESTIGMAADVSRLIDIRDVQHLNDSHLEFDSVFLTRHINDIVPNPWIAFEFGQKVRNKLLERYDKKIVINNFVFIIEELRKHLSAERDRLAETIFHQLVKKDVLRLLVISDELSYKFPQSKIVSGEAKTLTRVNNTPLERSLFDFVPDDEFNETEKSIAWYLDNQDLLFFWYRNAPRADYSIQGWKRHKIYPDFIFTTSKNEGERFNKVFIAEVKGTHLKGNVDTVYKRSVFDMCNKLAKEIKWEEFGNTLKNLNVLYEVVDEEEWENKLNALIEP